MSAEPPRLAKFLLTLTARGEDRSFVADDLQEEFDAMLAEGGSAREARRWYWRQVLGSVLPLLGSFGAQSGSREARRLGSLRTLVMDFRHAGRGLLRTPGQTIAAIITLGLGIGITTAEFGMLYGLFYRALPFEDADQLVAVWRTTARADQIRVPVHDFVEWREAQRSFTDLAADYTGRVGLRGSEESIQFDAAFVSWNALPTLGAQPTMGRGFLEEDDQFGAPLVAIVSHRVWAERFGEDAGIVGREAVINGEPATIIGVMPDGFHFPIMQDVWVPLRLDATQTERGQGPSLEVFGRLRDGVTLESANAEMAGIAQRIAIDHPQTDEGMEVSVRAYSFLASNPTAVLVNWMIMVSSLGVLLIACVNVANLLLARSAVRTREIALRTAMGARRLQIMVLMLAESSILALLGALVGIGIASLGLVGVRYGMTVVGDMPYWAEFKLDRPALLFTSGAAAFTGIVAGMIPAMRATTGNLTDFLKDGSRSATGLKIGRLSRSLVAVAVAFSTCLLIVAGLTTKAMTNLASFDIPFDEQGVFTAGIDLFDADSDEQRRLLLEETLDRLDAVPGVLAGALTSSPPGVYAPETAVGIEGRVYLNEQEYPVVHSMTVSAGFFDFLGVEPLQGRAFSRLDRAGEQPVAIVNQSFATRHFPEGDPIGRRLRSGRSASAEDWRTVVGVVPDLLMQGMMDLLETAEGPGFYVPLAQADNTSLNLLVRSQGAPLELTEGVRDLVSSIDPDLGIFGVGTLSAEIRGATWYLQMLGGIYIIFGAVALFLAAVGLFAVVSFGAERRTQEIGVRMAVGAKARDVVRLVVTQGVTQVSIGLVVGLVMAVGLARVMAVVLFQTEPWDPLVYGAMVSLILLVGVLACLFPAVRAARLDPVRALQSQ